MIEKDLHQNSKGPITLMKDYFNLIDGKYPEEEATKKGINSLRDKEYKKYIMIENEKDKEKMQKKSLENSKEDFGIGEY